MSDAIRASFPIKEQYDYNVYQSARDEALKTFKEENPGVQVMLDDCKAKYKSLTEAQELLGKTYGLAASGYVANEKIFAMAGGRIVAPATKPSAAQIIELVAKSEESVGLSILKTYGIIW